MPLEGRPAFVVCNTPDGMEFYVLIVWPDGAQHRINFFPSRKDAERWIERESEGWIQQRSRSPST